MLIAVTSQNRRNITGHAGKCRNFWVYRIEDGAIAEKRLLELPIDQSLHARHDGLSDGLQGVEVLISGGMGAGLHHRLGQYGVAALLTDSTEPDLAVNALLSQKTDFFRPAPTHECHDHTHASH